MFSSNRTRYCDMFARPIRLVRHVRLQPAPLLLSRDTNFYALGRHLLLLQFPDSPRSPRQAYPTHPEKWPPSNQSTPSRLSPVAMIRSRQAPESLRRMVRVDPFCWPEREDCALDVRRARAAGRFLDETLQIACGLIEDALLLRTQDHLGRFPVELVTIEA